MGYESLRDVCCVCMYVVFFFKQKTAYEMRSSDWSSDVCSSDLTRRKRCCRPRAQFGGFNWWSALLVRYRRNAPNNQTTRSEEHTSELQSLMRISYAVFCLKKKNHNRYTTKTNLLVYKQDQTITMILNDSETQKAYTLNTK